MCHTLKVTFTMAKLDQIHLKDSVLLMVNIQLILYSNQGTIFQTAKE